MNNQIEIQSTETNLFLYDFLLNLLRYWYMPVICLLVFLVVVSVYLSQSTPMYESEAIVRIGQINVKDTIEDQDVLVDHLRARFDINNVLKQPCPCVNQIELYGQGGMVKITAIAEQPVAAQAKVEEVVAYILQRHKGLADSLFAARVSESETYLAISRRVLSRNNDTEDKIRNPILEALIHLESSAQYEAVVEAAAFGYKSKEAMGILSEFATEIAQSATLPSSARYPRVLFVYVVGGVGALFFGVMLIILRVVYLDLIDLRKQRTV